MSVDCEVGWELEFEIAMVVVWGAVWEFLANASVDLTEPPSLELTPGADCLLGLLWAWGARHPGDGYAIYRGLSNGSWVFSVLADMEVSVWQPHTITWFIAWGVFSVSISKLLICLCCLFDCLVSVQTIHTQLVSPFWLHYRVRRVVGNQVHTGIGSAVWQTVAGSSGCSQP